MRIIDMIRDAMRDHGDDAKKAYAVFVSYCGEAPPRVPGCDTVYRLALRLAQGRSIEEAAAREYIYRWNLAIPDHTRRAYVFGVPHLIGG